MAYYFGGSPVGVAAAAKAHAADAAAAGQAAAAASMANGQVGTAREQGKAAQNITLSEQPANFGNILGGLYNSSAQAAPNLLGAYTQPYATAYNGYMAGLGGLGNAMGAMGAGAMQGLGATGQQLAANLGQIGSSQANSLAAQSNAAANAYGQLGIGNYNMQGQLGTAMAQAAAASAAAQANAEIARINAGPQYAKLQMLNGVLPGLLGGSAGGGFNASGPQGMIASGSYSAPSWSGGMPVGMRAQSMNYPKQPAPVDYSANMSALGNFLNSQMDRMALPGSDNNRVLEGLGSQLSANRDATLSSGNRAIAAGNDLLPQLGGQINSTLQTGTRALQGLAGQMNSGFDRFANDTGNAYTTQRGMLNDQFNKTFQGVNDLWDKSLGKNDMFMTPVEKATQQAALGEYNRQREDQLYASGNDPGSRRRLATQRAEEDKRLDYLQRNQISADRETRIQADTEARQRWWNSMTPRQRRLEGMKQNPFGPVGGWQNSLMRGQTW